MPRRVVTMFMPRFACLVEALSKPHTIRPVRKRPVRVGDLIDAREWLGKPYRSKQRKLIERVCVSTRPVSIRFSRGSFFIRLDGKLLTPPEAVALAQADGFSDAIEMMLWFKDRHGLPFNGVLLEWVP